MKPKQQTFLTNRYVSLLIETGCVTTWALWVFRTRSTDEVAGGALVVMITIVVVGEMLTRILPPIAKWINSSLFKSAPPDREAGKTTASFPLSVRVAGVSTVAALIVFVLAEAYGLAFLLSVPLLKLSALDWAIGPTFVASLALISLGIIALVLATVAVLCALFSAIISWPDLTIRLRRKTVRALLYVLRLQGFATRPEAISKTIANDEHFKVAASH